MRRVLTAAQMQAADKNTIEGHYIPAAVLMERAAAACVFEIEEDFGHEIKVGILCGPGNNGGDGVAIARLLHLDGYDVKVLLIGDEKRRSKDLEDQIRTAKSYNVPFADRISEMDDCGLLVDALFGVGLKRDIGGEFAAAIDYVNRRQSAHDPVKVLSVDIPSGISSDSGRVLGTAVQADITVTFGYKKIGHCLGEGYLHSGRIFVADVGIYVDEDEKKSDKARETDGDVFFDEAEGFELDEADLASIPRRDPSSNKGDAKVLVIAGSRDIYGACYLSAKAAYRAGAGYVKVYTHSVNLPLLKEKLPEAVCIGYEKPDENELKSLIGWADAVLLGPGISTGTDAGKIVRIVLKNCDKPLVIDADAINVIAKDNLQNDIPPAAIITPHLLEMSRLTGLSVREIQEDMAKTALEHHKKYDCTVVLKSYTSVIAGCENDTKNVKSGDGGIRLYFNTSGSEALATAGSGDVLSGIMAAFAAKGMEPSRAAAMAAFVHGRAGRAAANESGNGSILASDIINYV